MITHDDPVELAGLSLHESSHAVLFVVGSLPFRVVELTPDDPVTLGAVRGPMAALTRPRALFVALVSGAIAEHYFTGTPMEELARTCAAQDFEHADDIARDMTPELITALWVRSERLVVRHAHAISRVAAELCAHRTLTESEVRHIVHNPRSPTMPTTETAVAELGSGDSAGTRRAAADLGTHRSAR